MALTMRRRRGLPTRAAADPSRLSRVAFGWYAVWASALTPDRHAIPDHVAETRRYVEACAAPGPPPA